MDIWTGLFDTTGFVPRAQCGVWTPGLIWLHNASDFLIWSAYLAIPIVLVAFAWKRRRDLPFRALFALFGIFILACGTTHLMDIVMFYYPLYRFAGAVKLVTAAASWGTVLALTGVVPRALAMRSPDELEREIAARNRAEAELQSAHDNMEARVEERSEELLAASAQLRLSEQSFRLVTEVMPQIVWTARPDGFLDYYNGRWIEYTGMSIEQTQGWGWQPVLHPDDVQKTTDIWQNAVASGEPYEVEYRFKRASDGMYRWHLGRAMPQRDEAGKIVKWFGTCTDIHDQKQAQQELLRSHAELENRVLERTAALLEANAAQQILLVRVEQSNQELQEFASIASHDLQEPLRKIQAFGDRLQTKCASQLSDEGRDYVQRMQNSAGRMRVLIDDLLQFARVAGKAAPRQTIDLEAVVAEVMNDLEETLRESGGKTEVESLPDVQADPRQMQQLFQNLISNALKFRGEGVLPLVRIYEEAMPPDAETGLTAGAAMCRIVVADNGIGFDEQYADRIFSAFQRLHGRDEYVGTGIGLAICRKIVHQHGGEIGVQSAPGEGARFFFDLPRGKQPEEGESRS